MESTRSLRIASRSILFAILACALLLLLPIWPYSSSWGYYPGLIAAALLVGLAIVFFRVSPRNL